MKTRNVQGLLLLGIGMLALILLAAGLGSLELLPGRPLGLGSMENQGQAIGDEDLIGLPSPFDLVEILLALTVWVLLPLLVVVTLLVPALRREMLKRLPAFVGTMLLLFWLLRFIEPLEPREPPVQEGERSFDESSLPGEALPATPDFISDPPSWLVVLVSTFLAAALLALGLMLWRRLRATEPEAAGVTAAAEEALERLRSGADLKDTVMRCYLEMSHLLEREHGLKRQQAMTPREFGQHLAKLGWQSAHIARLTGLFERVRYGSKAPGPREEQEAEACLSAIVQAYGS